MGSLANQLEAPTTARKCFQADLLSRLSGCSVNREEEEDLLKMIKIGNIFLKYAFYNLCNSRNAFSISQRE